MATTTTETTAAIEARLAAAYPSFNLAEGVVQMQADIRALLAVVARLAERDAVYPPTVYYEGGAARRAGQPDTPPYATQAEFTAWRHGWATHEALMVREAQVARLTAALEVATRGWVRLPDCGDPHCRYCGGTGVGTANFVHTEDCPVRVFWETQALAGTGGPDGEPG